jgi:hypothetical protein
MLICKNVCMHNSQAAKIIFHAKCLMAKMSDCQNVLHETSRVDMFYIVSIFEIYMDDGKCLTAKMSICSNV